jgi:hypothetical protein
VLIVLNSECGVLNISVDSNGYLVWIVLYSQCYVGGLNRQCG